MKKLFAFASLVIGIWSLVIPASAQVPQLINYQGRLLSGTNLVNGNVGLSLRLFDAAAAGTLLYEDSNSVTVVDGLYSTFIGDNPTNSAFLSALTNAAVWIEVAVNGVALSPRERLSSVAYSLNTRGMLVDAKSNLTMFPDENSIADSFFGHATISGGFGNSIMSNSRSAFLGGGDGNSIQPFAGWSVLGGGSSNSIQRNANFSFLGGGFQNSIQTNAVFSFLGGGYSNSVTATYGTVPGGFQNNAGYLSFAAGRRAKATNDGSFVWADSTDADFGTTSSNQFLIRASGGVGIGTNITSGAALNVAGAIKATSFSGDGSGLTGISVSGAAIVDGTISNADLSASVLTNISARADSNLVWSTFATVTGLTAETTARIGGDASLSNTVASLATNVAARADSNLVWSTFAAVTSLTAEATARIGGDASLSNSVASLATNVAARADSNLVWSTFAAVTGLTAETTARIGGDASLSNTVASLTTNVAARLASNVWATANATTNYVRRTGDSMSGALTNLVGFAGNGTGLTNVYSVRAISVNSNNNIFVHNPAENSVDPSADHSTLGGGYGNSIAPNAIGAFLGGGSINGILSNATYSFLGGGEGNSIQQGATLSCLGGGEGNSIQSNATHSFVGGGYYNGIAPNASGAFLGGGSYNSIQSNAAHSFLGGGEGNSIQMNTTHAFLGGGYGNSVTGPYGTVPGGGYNSAGYYSFAAGRRAKATHDGSFVWADSTDADFGTTSSNQFLIRASGGVGIGTAAPTAPLTVQAATNRAGENTATFYAPAIGFNKSHIHYGTNGDWFIRSASGSGNVILQDTGGKVGIGTSSPTGLLHVAGNAYAQAWLTTSDRNVKQDIAPVDAAAILEKISALPVASWSFKTEPDVKHIGPMAQDFRAAFGLGPNDTSIATVDADGVALAAIQALARQNTELRTANDELKKEFDDLRARLDALEKK